MEPLLCKCLCYSIAHSRNLLPMLPSTTEVHICSRAEVSEEQRYQNKSTFVGIPISRSWLLQVQLYMERSAGFFSWLCACMLLCTYTNIHNVCVILFVDWSHLFSENAFTDCQRSSVGLGLCFRLFLAILGRESCWCHLKLTVNVQLVLITFLSLFHFLLPYFIFKVEDGIPLRTEL